jgi:hypothetical protein|tara:strand:- start:987 stop:1292 length:306 start_codon:yes stop_codon:yes gene_type:complete
MKGLVFFLFLSVSAYGQNALVHINADFNKSNDWYGLTIVENTKIYNGYIDSNPAIKKKYNVVRVPTLILFKDGVEVERWVGGLDMKLHIKVNEVQNNIDNK